MAPRPRVPPSGPPPGGGGPVLGVLSGVGISSPYHTATGGSRLMGSSAITRSLPDVDRGGGGEGDDAIEGERADRVTDLVSASPKRPGVGVKSEETQHGGASTGAEQKNARAKGSTGPGLESLGIAEGPLARLRAAAAAGGKGCPVDGKGHWVDMMCVERERCVVCGGCRARVKLARLPEAGAEVALVRGEHCSCADRVSIRTEVLKNHDALVALRAKRGGIAVAGAVVRLQGTDDPVIVTSTTQRDPAASVTVSRSPTSGINTGSIHVQLTDNASHGARVRDGGAGRMGVEGEAKKERGGGGDAHANLDESLKRAMQRPPLPTEGSSSSIVSSGDVGDRTGGRKRKRKKSAAAVGAAVKKKGVTGVVVREAVPIEGIYCFVTMRQTEDKLQVEAVELNTGELHVTQTPLTSSFMERKTAQQREELYKQILTQQLAFRREAAHDPGLPGGAARYMHKSGMKKRLVVTITSPPRKLAVGDGHSSPKDPTERPHAHRRHRRSMRRGTPVLSELMIIDGAAVFVKAYLHTPSQLTIYLQHQSYNMETSIAFRAVVVPVLARLKHYEQHNTRIPAMATANGQLPSYSSYISPNNVASVVPRLTRAQMLVLLSSTSLPAPDEGATRDAIRKLCQAIVFRRVEQNLQLVMQPGFKPEMAELVNNLSALDQAAVTVQACVRGHLGCKRAAEWIVRANRAAVCIQKRARGWLSRRAYRRRVSLSNAKARLRRMSARLKDVVKIQAFVRMVLARRRYRAVKVERAQVQQIRKSRRATELREAQARMMMRAKAEMERGAAVTIQSTWRGKIARDSLPGRRQEHVRQLMHSRAACIQRGFRCHRAKLETAMRRAQKRTEDSANTHAACVIQCAARAHLARVELARRRSMAERAGSSATAIQCAFRGRRARNELSRLRAARKLSRVREVILFAAAQMVVKLNRVRVELVRREYERVKRDDQAAMVIQCAFRGKHARGEAAKRRQDLLDRRVVLWATAVKIIVIAYRAHTRMVDLTHGMHHAAAVRIQRSVRGKLARAEAARRRAARKCRREAAAVCIQSHVRGHQARREVNTRRRRKEEEAVKQKREQDAALTIQRVVRGRLARVEVGRRRVACRITRARITLLITASRMVVTAHRARVTLARRHGAALTIQSAFRCNVARNEAAARRANVELRRRRVWLAAITLQRCVRGYLARVCVSRRRKDEEERRCRAAAVIERAFCRHLSRRERKALSPEGAALVVQRVWRGYQARVHLAQWQAWWAYEEACTVKIQRIYRGYYVRKYVVPKRIQEKQQEAFSATWRAWETQQAAPVKIQAVARGWLARLKYRRLCDRVNRAQVVSLSVTQKAVPHVFEWLRERWVEKVVAAVCSGEVDAGAMDADGDTLMVAAVRFGVDVVNLKALQGCGVGVNAPNVCDGKTALHVAMEMGLDDVVDWLKMDAGADDTVRDFEGHTCYYYEM